MATVSTTDQLQGRGRLLDRIGDKLLYGLTAAASLLAVATIILIAWKIFRSAHLSFSQFGISFLWGTTWDVNKAIFGALPALFGTAVTCTIAMVIAAPLGLAIALFLSEIAPRSVQVVIGSLVETLAAVPSVVLGLWGILVLGPFVADHGVRWLDRWLGFIPLFKTSEGQNGASSLFVAGLILAIMV